ncbi:hypothetical protein Tco_0319035 [Tanacetum coccineum]
MDNPNLTMEEYIRLEEEKARKRGKVFNWQTATYGKIRVDDDFYDLRSMEAEFPAIVVNDDFAPKDTLQCKSQVSIPVNDEIDFRISFDESDDEDYTIICDKNSFSYKMISVNNLKTDSENNYEKVMPSISSPEPAISCFDDLDFFKGFENEFPAIVYNDAQTSKPDLLTKPILNPQHIDEFDLSDETSLSEYDEEEQNVLYFNDLFPFNIIRHDDLKLKKGKDDNDIDITQSLLDNKITHGSTMLFETSHDKVTKTLRMGNFVINLNVKIVIWIYYANGMLFYLIMNLYEPFGVPFDPKRYEGLEYTDSDIADFESRLERIYSREIHRVQVVDSQGPVWGCDRLVSRANVIKNQVMAISVISVSSDSSEDNVGTPAGRVILFSTIPTTIPDTTPVITPPTTQTDTTVIPTETPIIAPTIPPSLDYTPASPDYSPASDSESDLSKDPSSDHIPPLPAISPFLSSVDDTTNSNTPDTPPSPTYGIPVTEITSST